jgi:Zn-dependent peptidase ImmA (M78 family)
MTARRELILEAAHAAARARDDAMVDDIAPIDVFLVALRLGARVRFVDFSMEGFYQKGPPALILVSSLRPFVRRTFTCAHELGHHRFGHGSTVDEMKADDRRDLEKPEEILAETFGGFLLMPTIGIRRAFAVRQWKVETARPVEIMTVASEFGVGYRTLISHLTYGTRDLSPSRRTELLRIQPKTIRQTLIGEHDIEALTIIDRFSETEVIDVDVGYGIAVPHMSVVKGQALAHVADFERFRLFRAVTRGTSTIHVAGRVITARVGPVAFVGQAKFRFLEDTDD